jgi:FkbM family methyltransferase
MTIFEHYRAIVNGATKPVVIEIGAADGGDTTLLLDPLVNTGREYRFLAFECEPKNFPKFRARGLTGVEFFEMAMSDACGWHRFVGSGSWPYSGSLKEPKLHRISHAWIPFEQPSEVPCTTLDSVFQSCRLDHIDFVWMDVQGAEDLVIDGGKSALTQCRFLYTEYYGAEEYAGQLNRDQIQDRLPGAWEIVEDWSGDVLFRNTEIT